MSDKIGVRMKKIRLALGLSKSNVSMYTGISNTTLSRIESGEEFPSKEVIDFFSVLAGTYHSHILGVKSDALGKLQLHMSKLDRFDRETREFAIKKIKQLIDGLDINN